jgi:membrane protease subunit HflC
MNRIIGALVAIVVAAIAVRMCTFAVDQRASAVVFALGQINRVVSEPGLHAKLPFPLQNVETVDKRILTIDNTNADRVQTSEKKNLLVDSFIKWRITDPRSFWVNFQGSERAAEDRISTLARDAISRAAAARTVSEITSRQRDRAMEEVRAEVQDRVKNLGVAIVDVRLRRVDLLPEAAEAVYRRMEAERKRVADEQRAVGAAENERIRADADRQKEVLLAEAYRDAQRVEGAGDAKAASIYAQAFGEDPEFFAFYRSLEAYRRSFHDRGDLLVVDPSSAFFRYMKEPGTARPAR